MTCPCGHRRLTHRYTPTTRRNDGPCLAPGCRCGHELEETA